MLIEDSKEPSSVNASVNCCLSESIHPFSDPKVKTYKGNYQYNVEASQETFDLLIFFFVLATYR